MRNSTATPLIKSRTEQVVEHRHGAAIPDLLHQLYSTEGLTQQQVAARLGTTRKNVNQWMVKYRIPTRDRRALASEAVA